MTLFYVHAFYHSAKKHEEVHMNVPAHNVQDAFDFVRSQFNNPNSLIVERISALFEFEEAKVN